MRAFARILDWLARNHCLKKSARPREGALVRAQAGYSFCRACPSHPSVVFKAEVSPEPVTTGPFKADQTRLPAGAGEAPTATLSAAPPPPAASVGLEALVQSLVNPVRLPPMPQL